LVQDEIEVQVMNMILIMRTAEYALTQGLG